jgi:hypothetical protein
MGKEQRSNKEKRKPKADKAAKPSATASAFPTAPGMGKGKSSAPPKKG